jgi:O-antigen/teichoic acid export membrane protein
MNSTRDLVVLLAGRAMQMIYAVLAIRILTSTLSPIEVGRFYILTGLLFGFNVMTLTPVSQYMGVRLLEWIPSGNAQRNHIAFAKHTIGIVVAIMAISVTLQQTIGVGTKITAPWLAWLVTGSLLIGTWNLLCTNGFNILGYRVEFVLFTNLTGWLGLGLSILLATRVLASAEYWVSGQLLGQAVVLIPAGMLFWWKLARPIDGEYSIVEGNNNINPRKVFQFSWPLSLSLGLSWVQWQSYRFILQRISGEGSVGLFAAGYAVTAAIVSVYESLFSQLYLPILYKDIAGQDPSGRARAWDRYANLYLPSIAVTISFVAASGPFLARLMVGSHFYEAAVTVAPIAALAEGVRMVSGAYSMAAFAQLDLRAVILPTLVGTAVTLFGVIVFNRLDPLLGTGFALLLGAIATVLLAGVKLHRTLSLHLPSKRLFLALVLGLPFTTVSLGCWLIRPSVSLAGAASVLPIMIVYWLVTQFYLAQQIVGWPEVSQAIRRIFREGIAAPEQSA